MKKQILSLALAVNMCAGLCTFNVSAAQGTGEILYQNDFEDGKLTGLGQILRPGQNPAAAVTVENLGTEESPDYKMKAQSSGVAAAYIIDSASWTDYKFEADITWQGGNTTYPQTVIDMQNPAASDAWNRFQGTYPYVGYQFADTQMMTYCDDGEVYTPEGVSWMADLGKTLHMEVTVKGEDITFVTTANGKTIKKTRTRTVNEGENYIAFGGKWGGETYWDNIVVTDLSEKQMPAAESYLYENSFSENHDGMSIIKNSVAAGAENKIAVEDNALKFVLPNSISGANDVFMYVDGSDTWEEYILEITPESKTEYTYYRIYTNFDKTSMTGDSVYLMRNNADVLYNGTSLQSGTFHHEKNRIRLEVNKGETKVYILPQWRYDAGERDFYLVDTINSDKTSGGVAIEVFYMGEIDFTNLKVTDLRATAAIDKTKDLEAGDVVTVKFSENMNPVTMIAPFVKLSNAAGEVAVTDVTNNGKDEMYITIPDGVLSNETYTLTLNREITDANGDKLNNAKSFLITTKKSNFNIISSYPADGTQDLNILDDMYIDFDSDIDYTQTPSISLKKADGTAVAVQISEGNSTARRLYIQTERALESNTSYELQVSGVKSAAGDKMAGTKTISFKTADAAEEYLYYNDFSDGTLDGFTISKNSGNEDAYIKDGKLVIKMPSDQVNGSDLLWAKINGSENWSDFELSVDTAADSFDPTASGNMSYAVLGIRGITNTSKAAGIYAVNADTTAVLLGNSTKLNDIYKNGIGKNNLRTLTVKAVGNKVSMTYDGHEIFTDEEGAELANSGAVSLGAMYCGAAVYDNIKVKDLGISFDVENRKNLCDGDEIIVKFDRSMDTESFDSANVDVLDSEGDALNISARAIDDTTLAIKLPYGLNSNSLYTVVLKQDIVSAQEVPLSADKQFMVKTAVKDIHADKPVLKTADGEVKNLVTGSLVWAQSFVKNNTNTSKNYVLVMAVYKNNKLSYVKTAESTLAAKSEKTLTTESYTVEADENLSIRTMVFDSMQTITPLADSNVYGK